VGLTQQTSATEPAGDFYNQFNLTGTLESAFRLPVSNHVCDAAPYPMADMFQP